MPETTVHAPPSFAALLWLLAGYGALLVWYLLRRDAGPEARTAPVTPRWRPPEGLSPAAIAWLGGYLDGTGIVLRRALAAALADLAMKGHLRIDVEPRHGGLRLTPRHTDGAAGEEPSADALPVEEAVILSHLRARGEPLSLIAAPADVMRQLVRGFDVVLERACRRRFIVDRTFDHLIGGGIALITLLGFRAMTGSSCAVRAALVAAAGTALFMVLSHRRSRAPALSQPVRRLAVIFGGIVALPALLWVSWPLFTLPPAPLATCLALFALPPFAFALAHALPDLTPEGRRAAEELAGFRMYLAMAETPRLAHLENMPPAPRAFRRALPQAVAMGLESHWQRLFHAWVENHVAGAERRQAALIVVLGRTLGGTAGEGTTAARRSPAVADGG